MTTGGSLVGSGVSEIAQDFRILLLHGQHIMAGGAIVRDRAPVGTHMISVMTTEATRRVHVPDVARIQTPANLHLRENILQIDRLYRLDRVFDVSATAFSNLRVGGLVEPLERCRYFAHPCIVAWVFALQYFHRLFLNERQVRTDPALAQGPIDGPFGELKAVSGAIMAVHAVHHAFFAAGQLLRCHFHVVGVENSDFPVWSRVGDLWNRLPLSVGRGVYDLRFRIEMRAVNADAASPSVPADFQQQYRVGRLVLLVRTVAGAD